MVSMLIVIRFVNGLIIIFAQNVLIFLSGALNLPDEVT